MFILGLGVIVFGSDQEVAGVMAAVGRRGAAGSFGWVGSDGWSARALVAAGNEPVVEGTISVQPQSNPVRGFRDYFLSLTPRNNIRNPWFVGTCLVNITTCLFMTLKMYFFFLLIFFLQYFRILGRTISLSLPRQPTLSYQRSVRALFWYGTSFCRQHGIRSPATVRH